MNTIADFYELYLQCDDKKPRDRERKATILASVDNSAAIGCGSADDGDGACPLDESMSTTISESSTISSLESDSERGLDEEDDDDDDYDSGIPETTNRRVKFWDHVEIREYSVTVGEKTYLNGQDDLPLQLDWQHTHATFRPIDSSKSRGIYYLLPPRMSLEMRRNRLKGVGCYTDLDLDAIAAAEREYEHQHQRSSSHSVSMTFLYQSFISMY